MIKKKTKEEIEILLEGGKILSGIMKELEGMIKPDISTADLERKANQIIDEKGGRPAFKNLIMPDGRKYPSALCTSIDNEVVHAPSIPGRILREGQIVKIDMGMEYPINKKNKVLKNKHSVLGGYYTDMAKTFIVGKVDEGTRKFVDTTKECLALGIAQVKPGNTLNDIGKAIQTHAENNGYSVVREMVGHGVGHEVHEAPQIPHYEIAESGLPNISLEPGMVIAIEPMLNMGAWHIEELTSGFTFVTTDGSLSAQFEHTIAVTGSGNIIITE